MYISSTIRIAYCWEYNILYPLRNFFTKEWAEPMPGVHASATSSYQAKDEKEESSYSPKKTHMILFGSCVCAPWPNDKKFHLPFFVLAGKNTGKYESVFSTYIFWDQNSPTPCQVAQAPQARKWGVREVTTFSDTV